MDACVTSRPPSCLPTNIALSPPITAGQKCTPKPLSSPFDYIATPGVPVRGGEVMPGVPVREREVVSGRVQWYQRGSGGVRESEVVVRARVGVWGWG